MEDMIDPKVQEVLEKIEQIVGGKIQHVHFDRDFEDVKCFKPNCDCAEKEMQKRGTEFIKSYPCLGVTSNKQ